MLKTEFQSRDRVELEGKTLDFLNAVPVSSTASSISNYQAYLMLRTGS